MELLTFAAVVFGVVLALVTILLPFVIVGISSRVKSMDMTLKKMEHMMRHGK